MATWIMLRSAGIGAYLMLFASVTWGLLGTTAVVERRVSKAASIVVHHYISTSIVVFLVVHLIGLLLDKFQPFHVLDLLIPLHSSFRPVPVAMGVVGMYTVVIVLVTSWWRARFGLLWWRRVHVWGTPAFIFAMVHGIFSGTDANTPLVWWTYMVTGAIVLFLLIVRGLTAEPDLLKIRRPDSRPVSERI
ncbi:MAG: ferric reductase-like transmembrane domain-containing protein [Actinomycetota bacterium]